MAEQFILTAHFYNTGISKIRGYRDFKHNNSIPGVTNN